MRSVSIKTLENKLSEYIRLAASGETVLGTDRDRVVAELVPPRQGRSAILADALLAEAVLEGSLTPPTIHDRPPPPRSPLAATTQLMAELAADREDR